MCILMFIGLHIHFCFPLHPLFQNYKCAPIVIFFQNFNSTTNCISLKDWWSWWPCCLYAMLVNVFMVPNFLLKVYVQCMSFFCSWYALHYILHLLWSEKLHLSLCTCCISSFNSTISLCLFTIWSNCLCKLWITIRNMFFFFYVQCSSCQTFFLDSNFYNNYLT